MFIAGQLGLYETFLIGWMSDYYNNENEDKVLFLMQY